MGSLQLVLDIILRLYWRDGRLAMKNLREDFQSNKLQNPEEVWIPQLQVEDGARSLADVFPRSESLMVQKEGRPVPDDDARLKEG